MSGTEEAQDVIDTRALELATEANTRVQGVGQSVRDGFLEIKHWQENHESHDDERFEAISTKVSDGFRGIYSRLWIMVGGAMTAMFAIIMAMAFKG